MNPSPEYEDMLRWIDLGQVPQHIAEFRAALSSSDPYIRWAGAKGCGEVRDEASIGPLIDLLGTESPDLGGTDERRIAVWSLAKFGYEKVIPHVESDPRLADPKFAEGVADLIGEVGDPRCLDLLAQLLARSERSVLLWASLSAAKIGEPSIGTIRNQLSPEPELEKVFYLLDALSKIGTPAAIASRQQAISKSKHADIRSLT